MAVDIRVGNGYDIHPLVPGRKLVLGGVLIPFARGLGGWSDADVLTHAVIEAVLGAAGLGDIGRHFPPGDPQYKDVSSISLLEKVRTDLKDTGWIIGNIDVSVIAEEPKLGGYVERIQQRLAAALEISPERVNIKPKSANGLGVAGRGAGIAALAIALIEKPEGDARRGHQAV